MGAFCLRAQATAIGHIGLAEGHTVVQYLEIDEDEDEDDHEK